MQKILIGFLLVTIVGAVGVGVYDATRPAPQTESLLAADVATETMNPTGTPQQETAALPTTVPAAQVAAVNATAVQAVEAQNMVGDPWTASGVIAAMDDTGFTLALSDGSTPYVELGQPTYWQAQGVALAVGDTVIVDGFANGEQFHAGTVTTASGTQLMVRTADGQPMWSGGVTNGSQGSGTGQAQVAAADWITVSGTITAVTNGGVTMQTAEGETWSLQLGQPNFWQGQGVTLVSGDAVEVLGFWEGTQFQAGEIRVTATGARIMLRDPNGRPLWGGPGRNGNGGQGGGQGSQTHGQSAQGQGNSTQGGSAAAGAGAGQHVNALVPADQWETIAGHVVGVDTLLIMVQVESGETALVRLGQVDFWTALGYTFVIPELVTVEGYWLNGMFEAGRVVFGDGTGALEIRDATGQLLYGETATSSVGGRQYRGGRS